MKKHTRILVSVLLLIAVVALVVVFIKIAALSTSQGQSGSLPVAELEVYLKEHYPNYAAEIDSENATVTLVSTLAITYSQAVAHGAKIYVDELAPETYLEPVQTITADLIVTCHQSGLKTILLYRSSDGKDVFSVSSDGTIQTCWGR